VGQSLHLKWKMAVLLCLVLCWISPMAAFAQGGYGGWYGMGPGMMGGWGMGWFGGIFMIVFWVLVIVALVFFVRWLVRTSGGISEKETSRSRALEILKERYARGEIGTEEFEERKRLLIS